MARGLSYRVFFVVALLTVALGAQVHALGGLTLTAYLGSNVSVNGVNDGTEWSDASHQGISWASNNSSLASGADLWVKNNGTDLLVAVQASGPTGKSQGQLEVYLYTIYLLFDNDNNGVIDNYEAANSLRLIFPSESPTTVQVYQDLHYNSTQGVYVADTFQNGTAAGSHSNPGGSGVFTWEFAIPMTSRYPEHFNLTVNGSIGFEIVYSEQHYSAGNLVRSGWAYWQAAYPTGLPSGPSPSANGWAVIVRSAGQGPLDIIPPAIGTPSIQPASPGPSDTVSLTVLVTDAGSGVKNVSIVYSTGDWRSVNKTLLATYNPGSQVASVQIPAQSSGIHVSYYVVAFDYAGNRGLNNNGGSFFSYSVSTFQPPSLTPSYLNAWFFAALASSLAISPIGLLLVRRRRRHSKLFPVQGKKA